MLSQSKNELCLAIVLSWTNDTFKLHLNISVHPVFLFWKNATKLNSKTTSAFNSQNPNQGLMQLSKLNIPLGLPHDLQSNCHLDVSEATGGKLMTYFTWKHYIINNNNYRTLIMDKKNLKPELNEVNQLFFYCHLKLLW